MFHDFFSWVKNEQVKVSSNPADKRIVLHCRKPASELSCPKRFASRPLCSRLRVVPLSFSPSCVTRKNTRKNARGKSWGRDTDKAKQGLLVVFILENENYLFSFVKREVKRLTIKEKKIAAGLSLQCLHIYCSLVISSFASHSMEYNNILAIA